MSPSRHLHLYNVVIRRTRRLKCMPLGRRVNVSPPPHYKNIGKHELEPSRDRDFSLSPTKNPRKFTTHTLFSDRVKNFPPPRPSSGLPRIYIFAPGHARLRSYFTRGRGNYTARAGVKGGSQFSNPFEQSVYALRWPDNENWPTWKTIARQGADNASLLPFRVVLQRAANREFGGREETLEGGTS